MFGELDVWLYDKPASSKNTNNPRKRNVRIKSKYGGDYENCTC